MTRSQVKGAMRKLKDANEEADEEVGEINLVPYMDIVTNIIIFLLASVVNQVALGNINVSSPTIPAACHSCNVLRAASMRRAFSSVKYIRPPTGAKWRAKNPSSDRTAVVRYSATAATRPPARPAKAARTTESTLARLLKLSTREATTYARCMTYEYVMRSLECTRQPSALSALPTAAVPANASCATPGVIPSRAMVVRRNGRSLVLLPM